MATPVTGRGRQWLAVQVASVLPRVATGVRRCPDQDRARLRTRLVTLIVGIGLGQDRTHLDLEA